jgi:uncharacterized delta-60 repeat protein
MKKIFTLFFSFALIQYGIAQQIAFDNSYSSDGYCIPSINIVNEASQAFVVNSGGKALHVGYTEGDTGFDFGMARMTSTGTPDNTFGVGGINYVNAGSAFEALADVELYSNGKSLMCGSYFDETAGISACILMRLTSGGALDASFSTDGAAFYGYTGIDMTGVACSILSDGSVLMLCNAVTPDFIFVVIVKYDSAGNLDTNFGTDGAYTLQLESSSYGRDMVIDANGNILVSGVTNYEFESGTGFITRLDQDGNPDTGFGVDGIAGIYVNNSEYGDVQDMVLQSDGKILYTVTVSDEEVWVGRFNTNGSPDTGFSTDGNYVGSFQNVALNLTEIALDPNGRVVLGGYSVDYSDGSEVAAMLRLNADGTLDNTFNSTGYYLPTFPGEKVRITGLEVMADGKIMTCGYSSTVDGNGQDQYLMLGARFVSGTSSVAENRGAGFSLYPNPANSNFTVQLEKSNQSARMSLFDLSGNLIWNKMLNSTINDFDISQLAAGYYIVEVETADGISRTKLAVN